MVDRREEWQLATPVGFFIFNRPETTQRVFATVAAARPPKLLIVADGPREDRPGEAETCAAARAIAEQVDWTCDVETNYSDVNLGCRTRVATGLDWVFQRVPEAIIVEDDCLPHPTFFRFCEELLDYYRDDERVMLISGNNFQFGRKRTPYSYYFSRYTHIWGWATWRRAWHHYDVSLQLWPEIRDGGWMEDVLVDPKAVKYWSDVLQFLYDYRGADVGWDFQWTFACWMQNSLSILPNVNLVSNIGFTAEATHGTDGSGLADLPAEEMEFPLRHPPFVIRDRLADELTERRYFGG